VYHTSGHRETAGLLKSEQYANKLYKWRRLCDRVFASGDIAERERATAVLYISWLEMDTRLVCKSRHPHVQVRVTVEQPLEREADP
jgi:hypothetical protein